jgi:NAD(P)-dependent dehydrogenase (short-subunit alcohol dehydrogenase family)
MDTPKLESQLDLMSAERRNFLLAAGAGATAVAVGASHASAQTASQPQSTALLDPRSAYPTDVTVHAQPWPALQRIMPNKPDCGETSYRGSGRLAGRRALITGGDSGIGRAVAIAFAREGADVVINHLPQEEPDAADVLQLIRAEGRKGASIAGDLRNEIFCQDLIQRSVAALGSLDIVVSNAGYGRWQQDILDLSAEEWDQTVKTNLYAPFWLSKAVVPHLKPGSVIVFTGSVAGFSPSDAFLDYSASKAGVMALAKALAKQLAKRGIRVNAVAPGAFWTPLQTYVGAPQSVVDGTATFTPLGRYAQPVEIAPAYVTLVEGRSSFQSGGVWTVNGGTGIG